MFWHYDCANIQIFNYSRPLIPNFSHFQLLIVPLTLRFRYSRSNILKIFGVMDISSYL